MAVRYFFDDVKAWIELIETRIYHVKTENGGYDKTVLTYQYTCRWCQRTGTARSMEATKYLSGLHTQDHPDLTKDALAAKP